MSYGKIICDGIIYDNQSVNQRIKEIEAIVSNNNLIANDVIAIILPRGRDLICSMLALLEIELPFLLIDSSLPINRIKYMLDTAECKNIISLSRLDTIFANYIDINASCNDFNVKKFGSSLAYFLFTSGTTGNPKAVMIKREGLFNFVEAIPNILSLENEKISAFTNQSFDIFLLETVMALYNGFDIVLATDDELKNPQKLINIIKNEKITTIQMTVSRFLQLSLLDRDLDFLNDVKNVLIGGEQFPLELLKSLQTKKCNIYNMYGPTETTIWSSVSNLTNKTTVDIGKPISKTKMYIMNDDSILDKGVIGEICISGIGLAEGYYGRADLTSNAFIYVDSIGEYVYKTGDLGYINEEDNFICLGRKDNQIKLRGHRIELEEIDVNAQKYEGISLCATCYLENGNNSKLVCFYEAEKEIEINSIKQFLGNIIPDYMIPSDFIKVDKLIYTVSGKIDRKALLSLLSNQSQTSIKEASDDVLVQIITICEKVLEKKSIAKDSAFSNLEVNSINFVDIVVQIEDLYKIEFEDEKLQYAYFPTVNDLYKYVKKLMNKR